MTVSSFFDALAIGIFAFLGISLWLTGWALAVAFAMRGEWVAAALTCAGALALTAVGAVTLSEVTG